MTTSDPVATEAVEVFVFIYGAEAGDLALRSLATGGIYVAGGIAPRIAPAMISDAFREAFRNKGWFASFMERIPIRLVTNLDAPLLGAAMSGGRLFESPPPPASLTDGADMLRAGATARYRDDLLKSR